MKVEEIPQWIAQHGGYAGTPEANANGGVTHRAADGSYVNVVGGRVTMIGHGAPPPAADAQPAPQEAPARPGGGGMNQQEIEAWIAANGGPSAVQYVSSTKTVPNPAADPVAAQAAGVPFNPMAEPKITVAEESWVNTRTGATLRASRRPDGSFDVIENRQADPNKADPANPATLTPAAQRTAREEAEIAANAALPPDQDPRAETNADRAARAERTIKEQGAAERQAQLDAEAKAERDRQRQRQEAADARAEASASSSARQPVLAPDKKSWGYFDTTDPQNPRWVTIPPDKAPPLPGEPDKPPTNVEGVYGTWKQDNGVWTFVPVAEQPGGIKLPSGAPPMDTSSPQAAFDSFQRLTAWVHQQVAEGKLKPGDVRSVLEAPHAQVSMILDREKSQRADALSQRGQDVTLQTNALSNATTGYTSTLGQAMALAKGVDPGHNHTMNFLLGGLALQQAQAANLGWNPQGIAPVMANPMGGGVVPGPVAAGVRPYAPGVTPVPQNTGAGEPAASPAILQGSSLAPNAAAVPAPTGVGLPPPLLPPRPPAEPVQPGPEADHQAQIQVDNLPIMALNRSMGLGQGYDPAIAALKERGFDDATIQLAMQQHLAGV